MEGALQDGRAQRRTMLVVLAGLILATSVGLGLVYLQVFRAAASDLTRILPDRTAAWLGIGQPRAGLAALAEAPLWRHPQRLSGLAAWRSPNRPARGSEDAGAPDVAGLPGPLVRDLILAADRIELAWIPQALDGPAERALQAGEGGAGPAFVAFVAIEDASLRRRLRLRLEDGATPVERVLGYRIDALRPPLWQRWLGAGPGAPRVVQVDPWLILAWGETGVLADLLAARVEGREDAIRRRPGLDAELVAPQGTLTPTLAGALAPETVLDARSPTGIGPLVPEAGGRLAALAGAAGSPLNVSATVSARGEVARFRGVLGEALLPTRLALATTPGRLELIGAGPVDTQLAVSLATRDVATTTVHLTAMSELPRPRLDTLVADDDLWPPLPEPRVRARLLGALRRLEALPNDSEPIEIAVFSSQTGAGPRWTVLARSPDPEALGEALRAALETELRVAPAGRHGLAVGTVARPDGTLHLLAEARAMAADDGVPARSSHVVWGARAGLLLMTPDPASFGALHEAIARGETLGARRGGPALAPLDADQAAAVAFFVAPGTLASAARGALRLVTRQLASDVPLVATFTHDVEWFDLVTNLGPWTWLGALAATPRDTLDDALLAALPAACADRHKAMCRAWPHAPSCNPYSIMRAPLLSRACDALTSPRRDPRTPP